MLKKKKLLLRRWNEGLLDELNMLNKQIEDLSLKKGEIQQSINLLEEQEQARSKFSKELVKIEEQMRSDGVEEKIKKFATKYSLAIVTNYMVRNIYWHTIKNGRRKGNFL